MKGSQVDVDASEAKLAKYRDANDARAQRGRKQVSKTMKPETSKVSPGVSKEGSSAIDGEGAELADEALLLLPGESAEEAAQRLYPAIDAVNPDMPIEEARRVKEVYRALLNRLEFEKASGSVIDLELARTTLFECARGARDAWLNWPAKYSPLIAASLGLDSDKVLPLLEEYVHKQISELGLPDGDALVADVA